MLVSYHNHSHYSDGKASIAEMAEAADALGIDELGVSDHFVIPPQGNPPRWAMPATSLPSYIKDIETADRQARCKMRMGLELDWFEGMGPKLVETLKPLPLDYVLGSVHHVDSFCIDGAAAKWEKLDQNQINHVHNRYWQLMKSMAESRFCDIIAHIDLPKKFGFKPDQDLANVIEPALDAIAKAGLVVELNTAGWHKRCEDAYPSTEILQLCYARDIPVTISADAHLPAHLLRDFGAAAERLADVGYQQVARFKQREVWFEPLENAAPDHTGIKSGRDNF